MNTQTYEEKSHISSSDLTLTGIVAALYVAVTLVLSAISFGAIQLRLSEMFNYLALFHKRYGVAITLGVVIVNFLSPLWFLDVPIAGIATFIVLVISRLATKRIKNLKIKLAININIFTLSIVTFASQIHFVFDMPFWVTYATVGLGEFLRITIGGIFFYFLNKKLDLTK